MRILLAGFLGVTLAMGQAWFPMKDRKVGALDSDYDQRKSADFGFARIVSEEDNLRFEGKDHAGKPWRIWMPKAGIGGVDVWTADFDHDGQQDLLIRSLDLKVGRCLDVGTITIVLFDAIGRPVPWTMTTQVPYWNAVPLRGAIVLDANHDGRAEFVVTGCESSVPSDAPFGEDRGISGVYEAQHGRMVPIRHAKMTPYRRAAKVIHGHPSVKWLPMMPEEWPDQMQGFDSTASLRVEALLKGDEQYRHIDFPLVNGRFDVPVPSDPSEILSYDRILYSDGLQRIGWPYVVLDGLDGRDVYIAGYEEALRRVINARYRVKILGSPAEPTWIWANIN
jgi:hypothetical protein